MYADLNGKSLTPTQIIRYGPCRLFSYDAADAPPILYLEGDSYSRGYAYGKLLSGKILRTLAVAGTQLYALNGGWRPDGKTPPAPEYLEKGKKVVRKRVQEQLLPAVSAQAKECLAELQGLYDALQVADASVTMDDLFLLNFSPESVEDPSGCSNFSAWGNATADGSLLHAVNMDYSTMGILQESTVVCAVRPDNANSYLAITFAGSIMPTTFLNEKGLSYGEMTSSSIDRAWPSIPHYVQAKQMAETCATCSEAFALVKRTGGTSGFNLMVCQTQGQPEGVVIETAGARANLRHIASPDRPVIFSTNFFHTHPEQGYENLIEGQIEFWSRDAELVKRRFGRDSISFSDADTVQKWNELVVCPRDQFYRAELPKLLGKLDVPSAVKLQSTPPLAVYGDRQNPEYQLCEAFNLPYGAHEPLKNRWAMRSLYAAVMQPREGVLYVAAGMQPAQAGRYLKISFAAIEAVAARPGL